MYLEKLTRGGQRRFLESLGLSKIEGNLNTVGWRRFAKYEGSTFGNMFNCDISIYRSWSNTAPEAYRLVYLGAAPNVSGYAGKFIQLGSLVHFQLITQVRIVSINGEYYLEFYYSRDVFNTVRINLSLTAGWVALNYFLAADSSETALLTFNLTA